MPISVDEAVLARLTSGGENFEVLVDPKEALKLRRGKKAKELIAVNQVFKDSKKGKRQSESNLKRVFGTTDVKQIARKIVRKGKLHLTSEQRKELLEKKRKKIINMISRRAVDPKTGYPHPPKRIEKAMDELGINIDPFQPVEEQVSDIIDRLRPKLPISLEEAKVGLLIPPRYSAKSYSVVEKFGQIEEKKWKEDGSLMISLKIPLALRERLYNKLNKLTKGSVKIKVLERKKIG